MSLLLANTEVSSKVSLAAAGLVEWVRTGWIILLCVESIGSSFFIPLKALWGQTAVLKSWVYYCSQVFWQDRLDSDQVWASDCISVKLTITHYGIYVSWLHKDGWYLIWHEMRYIWIKDTCSPRISVLKLSFGKKDIIFSGRRWLCLFH